MARSAAEELLARELAHGPRLARDVYALAEGEGVAERTLRRALGRLHVRVIKGEDGWEWSL